MNWFVRGVRNNKHGLVMLAYMIFYLMVFRVLEARENVEFHVIHTALDDMIPFQEAFIIPYLLWFPFVIGTVSYFVFHKGIQEEYWRLAANLMMGMSIFLLVSWLYPNMLELRPQTLPRQNFLASAVQWLYRTDTPTNVLPSIHVFNSLACEIAVKNSPSLKNRRFIQAGSTVLTVLIILATMFLKQHSVVDVCLGTAMALLGWQLFYTQNELEGQVPGTRHALAYAQAGRMHHR